MFDKIAIVVGIIIVLLIVGLGLYYFFQLEKEKQLKLVKEWLLLAVIQAEKELGAGTGQIKLRYVYDMFLTKFTFLSHVITFEQFSALVDAALLKMNELLQDNKQIQKYIDGPIITNKTITTSKTINRKL